MPIRRFSCIRMLLIAYLWLPVAVAAGPAGALPEACQAECVRPFGSVLGTADQVTAYSNCSAACVNPEPDTVNGIYTGIKWQCVEYARRWLLQHTGAVFADVDIAADIWSRIDRLERVDGKGAIPLVAHPNGDREAPEPGDLLIYASAYLGTGHVAVITTVDLQSRTLAVAEQNYLNTTWPGDHAREIELVVQDGRYWVLDAYLLGWKHVAR
jgi:hypothetical protein